MERPSWTYEVPPAAADAAGLEDYVVETTGGDAVGKVKVLLQSDDDLLLAVEGGVPPVHSQLRAIAWNDIADVDHDAGIVRVSANALEGAKKLDPSNAIEGDAADATRVTTLPNTPTPHAVTNAGPVDRPTYLVAFFLAAFGLFGALGLITIGSQTSLGWLWALAAVPAVLLLLAGVAAYRFFRRPTERL